METRFKHQKLNINNSVYAIIKNVQIQNSHKELELMKSESLRSVLNYSDQELESNKVIQGYKKLLAEFHKTQLTPAGLNLVNLLRERKKPLTINTAVDAYNIIAAKSLLSIGAHDIDKIQGDVIFDFATEEETIHGVNSDQDIQVAVGDYLLRDSGNNAIISWLDTKDNDDYKIRTNTKNIFLVIEGNPETSLDFNLNNLKAACDLIVKFCGGEYEIFTAEDNKLLAKGKNKLEKEKTMQKEEKKGITQLLSLKDNETIIFQLQSLLQKAVAKTFKVKSDAESIEITKTDPRFGDFSTNLALKFSKEIGKAPRAIADILVSDDKLKAKYIEKIDVAGPGFINFFLSKEYYLETLNYILEKNFDYGKWNLASASAMVEYGHPNTHKAIQVGHLKSLLTGLYFVRIIQNLGFDVIQANFFGDVGMHVARCIWGFIKKGEPEGFEKLDPHSKMKYLNECYAFGAGEYKDNPDAKAEMIQINNKIYRKSDEDINLIYLKTRAWSIEHQAEVFAKVGVAYDRQYPESEIEQDGTEIVKKNIGNIFVEDQGAIILPGEKFDVNTAVFITGEGNPTYSAKDLGLAYKKFSEYPDLNFNLTSTAHEQNNHFKTVIKVLDVLDEEKFKGKYYHIGFGYLLRNNKKTSSRMGDTVKAVDLINEAKTYAFNKISEHKTYSKEEADQISEKIAICGLKFLILSHEIHKDINYDPDQFMNPEGFSGPYIMYGYVRTQSILRNSGVDLDSINTDAQNIELNTSELNLLKALSSYPNVTLESGRTLSSHIICNYLFELTQSFNQFYKENKVLVEDENVRKFRLALTKAVGIVLKNGMHLLGIDTVEQM